MVRNIISGILALAISIAIWIGSSSYAIIIRSKDQGVSPATFPRILATLIGIIGVLLLTKNTYAYYKAKEDSPKVLKRKAKKERSQYITQGIFLLLIIIYTWTLSFQSFLIPTIIFLWLMMLLFKTPILKSLVYAILFSILSYVIFVIGLRLPLGGLI